MLFWIKCTNPKTFPAHDNIRILEVPYDADANDYYVFREAVNAWGGTSWDYLAWYGPEHTNLVHTEVRADGMLVYAEDSPQFDYIRKGGEVVSHG